MALSTAVFVGEAKKWIPELIEKSKKLKVNAGMLIFSIAGDILYVFPLFGISCVCVVFFFTKGHNFNDPFTSLDGECLPKRGIVLEEIKLL